MNDSDLPLAKPIHSPSGEFEIIYADNWRFYSWRSCDGQRHSHPHFVTKVGAYQNAVKMLSDPIAAAYERSAFIDLLSIEDYRAIALSAGPVAGPLEKIRLRIAAEVAGNRFSA